MCPGYISSIWEVIIWEDGTLWPGCNPGMILGGTHEVLLEGGTFGGTLQVTLKVVVGVLRE